MGDPFFDGKKRLRIDRGQDCESSMIGGGAFLSIGARGDPVPARLHKRRARAAARHPGRRRRETIIQESRPKEELPLGAPRRMVRLSSASVAERVPRPVKHEVSVAVFAGWGSARPMEPELIEIRQRNEPDQNRAQAQGSATRGREPELRNFRTWWASKDLVF